jgi:ESCRT-II complex subunit VPS25
MDNDVMMKTLNILVKRGKIQIFGNEGEEGVKFF